MKSLLGFPGDLTDPGCLPSHYGTKVGGSPHIPEAYSSDCLSSALCGVCGFPLSLIFQTHAPLSSDLVQREIKERVLLLFSCLRKGCGKHPTCWKVYRLQMEESPGLCPVLQSTSGSGSIFGGDLEATKDAGFDLEGIRSALETLSKAKKKKKKTKCSSKRLFCEEQLPEFYLYAETEPEQTNISNAKEDAHVQFALEEYKAQMTDYEESIDPAKQDVKSEKYEKSKFKLMDGGVFWKFQQRLLRSPEQCVRYGFKSEFLSPVPSKLVKEPPNCKNCGSVRVFELQLTPHLMNAFMEAAEWIKSDLGSNTKLIIQKLHSNAERFCLEQEWSSVVVYTCSRSCTTNSVMCIEECVCVYDETNRMPNLCI
eukprot:g4622.t1